MTGVRVKGRKAGFTIIELMVSVSIVGLVISLLLPAVQNAREAARRTQCKSNLRQLGIAMHAYESVHRCFPMAAIPSGVINGTVEGIRFNAQLLPFLDQQTLYSALSNRGRGTVLTSHFNRFGITCPEATVPLPIMRCPSSLLDDFAVQKSPANFHQLAPFVKGCATTDYVAIGGPAGVIGLFPLITSDRGPIRRPADVIDGLSNTLAIGEHSYPGALGTEFPIWIATYGEQHQSNVINTSRSINCVSSYSGRFWVNARGSDCALSFHPGISQFALADGSVRAVSENLDGGVYYRLGAIADGDSVFLPF